jgi:hypothetical protein
MKKLLFLSIGVSLLLAACGSIDFEIVEKDYNGDGGKSTVRLEMNDPSEEDIQDIVRNLYSDEFFGSASIHAYIHDSEDGPLIAMAKYARSTDGLAQVGVDEINTVYVEWEG